MTWLIANIAPIMFCGLVMMLLTGFPVAFALAATGMVFGWAGVELGLVPVQFFNALPLRLYGIIANDLLLAIPFFTLMGLILERSRMAEDLLETIGQVFGPMRGGLAIAVVLVGALLAATTGVVAASVIAMGLISLPIMMRYGYNQPLAAGVITASGTLAQIIPPSLVLIVIAEQLGQSVGDMYKAAFIPAFALVAIYVVTIVAIAFIRPAWVPALPIEARVYRETTGSAGYTSLLLLMTASAAASVALGFNYVAIKVALGSDPSFVPATDELIVVTLTAAIIFAFIIAVIDKALGTNALSRLARQVTFVLIPPLMLVFLVLGTIFLGVATPTEGGAMGAVGALVLALARKRLSFSLLKQALDSTARLSIFVMMILIGSTLFSLTFTAINGNDWVKALFDSVPGGQMDFIISVSILVFFLGLFLEFFEIAFILLPLLLPVAQELGVNLVYLGVLIGMVLQTSFLTPPVGFSLFYLRSVSSKDDYTDKITSRRIKGMSTNTIYKGATAFVALQCVMVAIMIWQPKIVLMGLGEVKVLDVKGVNMNITPTEETEEAPPTFGTPTPPAK